jgi:2-polyprenyl-3-methyl-5-hydroxy-6-metoxy-1,4-benzoquinol methylase
MSDKNFYSKLTISNASFIKRFSHTKRFITAIKILDFKSADRFLDIGTGDGYFLDLVNKKKIKKIFGYEPDNRLFKILKKNFYYNNNITLKKHLTKYSEPFSKISCLEVLEHLRLDDQKKIFNLIKKNSTNNSKILIGVPIEIGISSFIKNLIRILLRQTHENTSFINIFKSLFNLKIKRKNNKYNKSHIGFDFNSVQKLILDNNFKILKVYYSPFNRVGYWLNSQIFWLIKKKN